LYVGDGEKDRLERRHNIRLKPFSPFYIHKNVGMRGPKYILYSILYCLHHLRLMFSGQYDVVFVRNALLAFPIIFFRPLSRARHVISLTDFLTGFLQDNDRYPKPVVSAFFWLERKIPLLFDTVFVITPLMKRVLVRAGARPSRVHVTYDGVDTKIFNPGRLDSQRIAQLRKELAPNGERIILYHGTIDSHSKNVLKSVIETAGKKGADAVFVILGQGKKYDELKNYVGGLNAVFPGYVSHERVPEYAMAADAGIIPYEKNFNSDMIITLKLLEYLAMGLPVASTRLASIEELFREYDFIRLCDSPAKLADCACELALGGKSHGAQALISSKYSWGHVTKSMLDTMEGRLPAPDNI
jgi:glycosyltransferase involved in cell wall biosynthesis